MARKRIQFRLEVGDAGRTVKRFIVAEEGNHRVRAQVGQPFVRHREKPAPVVRRLVRMELLRSRKGPLGLTRRMRTEPRRVAYPRHVAHQQFPVGPAQLQFGLESAVIDIPLRQPVPDKNHAFALPGRSHFLRALLCRLPRHRHARMRRILRCPIHRFLRFRRFRLRPRHARRRTLPEHIVLRPQIPRPVVILLPNRPEWCRFERINHRRIRLLRHRLPRHVQYRIDHQSAQVLIRKIRGRSHRRAESLTLRLAPGRSVFPHPGKGHHGIILRSGNRLRFRIERFRHRSPQQNRRRFLIEIRNSVDIRRPEHLAHPAQHRMRRMGRLHHSKGTLTAMTTVVIHPALPKNAESEIRPAEVSSLRVPQKGMRGRAESNHRLPRLEKFRKVRNLLRRQLPEPRPDDHEISRIQRLGPGNVRLTIGIDEAAIRIRREDHCAVESMTLTEDLGEHRTGFLGPVLLIPCHKDNLLAVGFSGGRQMESVSPGNRTGQGNEGK